MSAININNLSKKYVIGHDLNAESTFKYQSLRGSLTHTAHTILQRLRHPLSTKSRNKELEEFWALKDINIDVNYGEKIGIIGCNGSGKSTILKIISRITEPTTGEIKVDGRIVPLLEVGTGFHPELTGRENIHLNGSILGMSRNEINKKFDEIVDFAEVEKFLDTPVKKYSSGMYVRLAFAVAANLNAEILLIDEVLAVGDIEFQKKCIGKMETISNEGKTIIFISHNMSAIKRFCSRCLVLSKGRILIDSATDDAVSVYQSSIKNYQLSTERGLRETFNKNIFIKSVKIYDLNHKECCNFKYNDKFIIKLEIQNNNFGSNFYAEFRVWGENGNFISVGSSGAFHNIYYNKNVKYIYIEVGPLCLTDSTYFFSFDLVSSKGDRMDTWDNACTFSIIECHPFEIPCAFKAPGCVLLHKFLE